MFDSYNLPTKMNLQAMHRLRFTADPGTIETYMRPTEPRKEHTLRRIVKNKNICKHWSETVSVGGGGKNSELAIGWPLRRYKKIVIKASKLTRARLVGRRPVGLARSRFQHRVGGGGNCTLHLRRRRRSAAAAHRFPSRYVPAANRKSSTEIFRRRGRRQ